MEEGLFGYFCSDDVWVDGVDVDAVWCVLDGGGLCCANYFVFACFVVDVDAGVDQVCY